MQNGAREPSAGRKVGRKHSRPLVTLVMRVTKLAR